MRKKVEAKEETKDGGVIEVGGGPDYLFNLH